MASKPKALGIFEVAKKLHFFPQSLGSPQYSGTEIECDRLRVIAIGEAEKGHERFKPLD